MQVMRAVLLLTAENLTYYRVMLEDLIRERKVSVCRATMRSVSLPCLSYVLLILKS